MESGPNSPTQRRLGEIFPVKFWDELGDDETFADPQEFGRTVEFLDERETRHRLERLPICRSVSGELLRVQIISGELVLCHTVSEDFAVDDLKVVQLSCGRETLLIESYRGEITRALRIVSGRRIALPEVWNRPFCLDLGDWEMQAAAPKPDKFHQSWNDTRDSGVIHARINLRAFLRMMRR